MRPVNLLFKILFFEAENGIRKSVVYQDSADLLGIFNFRHNYNDDAHDLFALSLFSPERSD